MVQVCVEEREFGGSMGVKCVDAAATVAEGNQVLVERSTDVPRTQKQHVCNYTCIH